MKKPNPNQARVAIKRLHKSLKRKKTRAYNLAHPKPLLTRRAYGQPVNDGAVFTLLGKIFSGEGGKLPISRRDRAK
jgi:hypothetical protein